MRISIPLPHTARAASAARRAVVEAVQKWGVVAPLDDLLLVASELVTNAFRYGEDPLALHLAIEDGYVLIAVSDGDCSSLPLRKNPALEEDRGRGLGLIEATATNWGWERLDDYQNKVVWAQFPLARKGAEDESVSPPPTGNEIK